MALAPHADERSGALVRQNVHAPSRWGTTAGGARSAVSLGSGNLPLAQLRPERSAEPKFK